MLDTVDDETLKTVVNRYLAKVYPLVFYLIGNNSDRAYQVTASSYVEAFMAVRTLDDENAFLITLFKQAIEQSRTAGAMPVTKDPPFKDVPPERVKILQILSKSLQELSFDEKALLLLRDQIHLSYQNIAGILGISQSNVRSRINQARMAIRKKVEGALL